MRRSGQSQSPPRRPTTPIMQPPSEPFPSFASSSCSVFEVGGPSSSSNIAEEEMPTTINEIGYDILGSILSTLPARSFAYAACVNRTWNSICSHILSRPKICSALSMNPSLPMAVEEIMYKLLAGPIRPDFAILYVNDMINLESAHRLVAMQLGANTPMITVKGDGIMGRDVHSGQFSEIMGSVVDSIQVSERLVNRGILLTIGYLPRLKVQIVRLTHSKEEQLKAERFVRNVKDCSVAISGCSSPAAIMMFGEMSCRMKLIIHLLCDSLAEETIVVGNETTYFTLSEQRLRNIEAAAFVFARDRYKSNGTGKIQFHLALTSGVKEIGPKFKTLSVRTRDKDNTTWLTARREGFNEILDGIQILGDFAGVASDMYVGFTKKRNVCVVGSEKVKSVTYLDYHGIVGADEQNLYVHELDIKTGDPFRFYIPDSVCALKSIAQVSKNLEKFREDVNNTGSQLDVAKEVIGGFIFSCCGRREFFFGEQISDSSPVLNTFPTIPCAGLFCGGEIARGPLMGSTSGEIAAGPLVGSTSGEGSASEGPSSGEGSTSGGGRDKEDGSSLRSCVHVYGSAYLLLSYDPQPL